VVPGAYSSTSGGRRYRFLAASRPPSDSLSCSSTKGVEVLFAGIVKSLRVYSDAAMAPSTRPTLYKGYRFSPEIISRCVWLYYRFGVSLRDVSELMLARGIEVSHETIRFWTLRFGTEYARRLRRTQAACSNIWHLDELYLMINGQRGGIVKLGRIRRTEPQDLVVVLRRANIMGMILGCVPAT
jgi:hypothetical protein